MFLPTRLCSCKAPLIAKESDHIFLVFGWQSFELVARAGCFVAIPSIKLVLLVI